MRFVNIAKRGGVPHIVALRFVTFAKRGGVINIVAVAAVRSWGVRKNHNSYVCLKGGSHFCFALPPLPTPKLSATRVCVVGIPVYG